MEEEMEEPEEQGEVEDDAAEDGEPAILICATVAESVSGPLLEGYVVRVCSVCGEDVWVAPSGQRFLESEPSALVYCNVCAELKLMTDRAAGEEHEVRQLPESQDEILAYFRSRLENRRQKLTEMEFDEVDFHLQADADGAFTVKIHPEALKEWGTMFPGLPPMDELFMKVRLDECSICGGSAASGEEGIGAIDPEYIDLATGEVHGKVICEECLTKGE